MHVKALSNQNYLLKFPSWFFSRVEMKSIKTYGLAALPVLEPHLPSVSSRPHLSRYPMVYALCLMHCAVFPVTWAFYLANAQCSLPYSICPVPCSLSNVTCALLHAPFALCTVYCVPCPMTAHCALCLHTVPCALRPVPYLCGLPLCSVYCAICPMHAQCALCPGHCALFPNHAP